MNSLGLQPQVGESTVESVRGPFPGVETPGCSNFALAGRSAAPDRFAARFPARFPTNPPTSPAPFADTLVVTAARAEQRLTDAVAPTTVLTREDLARSPGLTLDDQLRQIPGFSLLRRSSSLTAHPTSQGVSLRGLGPSGASRTLVLFDGVPLNDPFGGWVYWNRLPLSGPRIGRGGPRLPVAALRQRRHGRARSSSCRAPPQPDTLEVTARGGDRRTGDLEVFAADAARRRAGAARRWGYTLSGRLFGTDGFYVVAPARPRRRGPPGHRRLRHPLRPRRDGELPLGGQRLPGGAGERHRAADQRHQPASARRRLVRRSLGVGRLRPEPALPQHLLARAARTAPGSS